MTISGRFFIPLVLISGNFLNRAATIPYMMAILPPGAKIPSPLGMPNSLSIWSKIFSSIRVNAGATSKVYLKYSKQIFLRQLPY